MTEMQIGAGGRPPKVLIIEDEQGLVDILTVNLEAAGLRVVSACDGLAGWQTFERELPDLVILDINLPVVSGFRLLQWFRDSERPHVPVLAITALDFSEAEELARNGLDAFVSKPFQPEDVVRAVLRLLEQTAGRDSHVAGR
jgi:DNA-binding response OmpR family regulator